MSGPVPPFYHTLSRLNTVTLYQCCSMPIRIIHSLWKTFGAIWQPNWKLCSCVLMDTAAISWHFVTWQFKAYFGSVRRVGNQTESFWMNEWITNEINKYPPFCISTRFIPDREQNVFLSQRTFCECCIRTYGRNCQLLTGTDGQTGEQLNVVQLRRGQEI